MMRRIDAAVMIEAENVGGKHSRATARSDSHVCVGVSSKETRSLFFFLVVLLLFFDETICDCYPC